MSLALMRAPRNSVLCEPAQAPDYHQTLYCVREAARRVFGKQELAATALGVSKGHWAQQLAGLEPLRLEQVARSPQLLDEFAALLAKARGHRLARRLTPAVKQRRIERCTATLELARLDLEDAIDDATDSGASAIAS